jgi:uncharacterized protein YbjT (DUF2867 family)
MSRSQEQRVLLVGATGMLGGSVANAILERSNLALRVLIRPGKREVGEAFRARGAEVAEGDALNPGTLPSAVAGVDVVVCALPNDPNGFVAGHQNIIEAAELAGVRRFIPSDFSVDYFKIDAGENFNLAMRKQVVPLFVGRGVRPIHVLIGAFIDTMLDPRAPFIDWKNGVLPYFGDGVQPCDFTSVADAARYVAAACADREAPEVLRVAGDVRTMPQFAESISRAFGRRIEPKAQGSVDDLARLIAAKQATASNPWEWISLQYLHNMVSGRAKLDPLDNSRYPQVFPESVEQFAGRTGEGNARGMSFSAL